jgi:hypothetical protein
MKSGLLHEFVVLAHGESPHLETCLRSLMAQVGADQHVSIFTSTPSAHHDQIARKFAVEIRTASTPGGIGENWNRAYSTARSRYVTLAHQDDVYAPDYLRTLLALMQRVPNSLMGFTNSDECSDAGRRPTTLNLRIKRMLVRRAFGRAQAIHTESDKRRLLAWGNPVCCPSVMLHRERLEHFRFREDLTSNLDWEAWANLAAKDGAFCFADGVLVSKRVHASSETTALIANRRREQEDRVMFRRFWPPLIADIISSLYRASYRGNRVS